MNNESLEIVFRPVFDFVACPLASVALVKDGNIIHEWHFTVRRGSTFHGWMLIPFMEKIQQVYMGTTRGLQAAN